MEKISNRITELFEKLNAMCVILPPLTGANMCYLMVTIFAPSDDS